MITAFTHNQTNDLLECSCICEQIYVHTMHFQYAQYVFIYYRVANSSQKLFAEGERLYLDGDEEKAYIVYMRYFSLICKVKKSADYKKDQVRGVFQLYQSDVDNIGQNKLVNKKIIKCLLNELSVDSSNDSSSFEMLVAPKLKALSSFRTAIFKQWSIN